MIQGARSGRACRNAAILRRQSLGSSFGIYLSTPRRVAIMRKSGNRCRPKERNWPLLLLLRIEHHYSCLCSLNDSGRPAVPHVTALAAQGGGVYNVLAAGAKGDGVTDDTAAIQAAINTADQVRSLSIPNLLRFSVPPSRLSLVATAANKDRESLPTNSNTRNGVFADMPFRGSFLLRSPLSMKSCSAADAARSISATLSIEEGHSLTTCGSEFYSRITDRASC